jgi:hypothetical protein
MTPARTDPRKEQRDLLKTVTSALAAHRKICYGCHRAEGAGNPASACESGYRLAHHKHRLQLELAVPVQDTGQAADVQAELF